jgi:transposase
MPAPISLDLRLRIVRAVEGGSSIREAARRFAVSPSAAIKLMQRVRATGTAAPARYGGHRRPVLEPHEADLRRLVADTTLIDLATGGSPADLEFAYTLSAQAKLVLTAHEVYLPKPKLAVEGPGGVQASFDFRGVKNDVAGRMLTMTLTNDLDGTEYA